MVIEYLPILEQKDNKILTIGKTTEVCNEQSFKRYFNGIIFYCDVRSCRNFSSIFDK